MIRSKLQSKLKIQNIVTSFTFEPILDLEKIRARELIRIGKQLS